MYLLEADHEFKSIAPQDLWVYNKLQLSSLLGYSCGPIGAPVPKSDYYIVRPSISFLGMGRNAARRWISENANTETYGSPGDFWCEFFHGDHISVDFYKKQPVLVVLGEKNRKDPYHRWDRWLKVEENVKFPEILSGLAEKYDWINCELIGGNLIEVHFRRNPDFRWNNSEAIPVYKDNFNECPPGYTYIEDPDYYRLGFYIK